MKKLLFLCLFVCSVSLTAKGLSPLIVGGETVVAGDPIARVTVGFFNGDSFCSGSIIAPDLIVTAAHCVADKANASQMRVAYGTQVLNNPAHKESQVIGFEVNPDWRGATGDLLWGDMALVRIRGDLPPEALVAELLPAERSLVVGEAVTLAGYGTSDAGRHSGTGVLRKTGVLVKQVVTAHDVAVDSGRGNGACYGDSGGPAFVVEGSHLYLWGVTSRAWPYNAPTNCSKGTVYTNIVSYADWIAKAAARLRILH